MSTPDPNRPAPEIDLSPEEIGPEMVSLESELNTDSSSKNATGKNVAKATAGIGVLHVLRLLVGFVAQPLIGNRLALAWQADVYTVATELVSSIWLLFEKVVNPTFLPTFARALGEDDEERAWRFASTALWLTALALIIVTPIALWQMPFIVGIYSQKAGAEQRELTIAIARLLMCGLFFLGISSLTYTILNGYKRFFMAALGDAFWKIGVAGAAFYAVRMQLNPIDSLHLLAWGFVVGAVLKLLPHIVALKNKWHLLKPKIDLSDPLIRKMALLAIPLILGIVISESRGVYLFRLADDPSIGVEGSRTALKFSRLIGTSLIQIFPYALSIGIFPYLADMARDKDRQPFTDTFISALRVCIFTFGPITAILIATRFEILRAVWESGNMTQANTITMSLPFIAFTLGLIGFACEMMFNQTFYAMSNAWTPTLIGIGCTVAWILAATFGVQYGAAAGLGLAAIAGAESFAKTLKCVVMWFFLRRHLGNVRLKDNLIFCTKVLIGSLLAAAVAGVLAGVLSPGDGELSKIEKLKMLLSVALSGTAGIVVFMVFGALTKIDEVQTVLSFAGKVTGKITDKIARR
jgi:putative peptidoglycan lipid II flippase